jgi:hypothetical protein
MRDVRFGDIRAMGDTFTGLIVQAMTVIDRGDAAGQVPAHCPTGAMRTVWVKKMFA